MPLLTSNPSFPADDAAAPVLTAPPPRAFWRRVGAGAVGGGSLGLLGLLSGFLVPLATLLIRVAHGFTQNYAHGGVPYVEFLELLFALFLGLTQGAAGLVLGLVAGFMAGALGPQETKPRRMRLAALVLLIVALASTVYLASVITAPSPSA